MGSRSRRKGRKWEQDVVRLMKVIFGDEVKRGLAQSRFGASEAPDVTNCPRLWIECKHEKIVNVRAAIKQAEKALAESQDGKSKDRWPVAICKDDPVKPGAFARRLAVMNLDDFLELLAEWWAWQGQVHVAGQDVEAQPGVPMPAMPAVSNQDSATGTAPVPERR